MNRATPASDPDAAPLLDALVAEAPIGLGVLDADLRYRFVNARLAEINGVEPAAHLGRSVPEVLPGLAPAVAEGFRTVLRTGEPMVDVAVTGQTPAAPGIRRQWVASYYPLRGKGDEVLGVGMAVLEVTAQRRMEAERVGLVEQIETERLRLDAVLRQMPAGVAIAEAPSGRLVLGNEQLEQIFRHPFRPSADISAYGEWEIFHGDGRPYAPDEWPLARSVTTGEVVRDEEVHIGRGDGTRGIISVSSSPIRDAEGRIVAAVATLLDISERRQAELERAELLEREQEARRRAEQSEHALRAQLSFTSALTENLGQGLWAFGADELITYVNPAAERMLGWSREELIGRHSHRTLHYLYPDGTHAPEEECPLLAVIRSRAVVRNDDDVLMRKDGTMLPVSYTSSPIIDDGEPVGGVMSFTDISERKRVEEDRARLLDLEHEARLRAERAERRSAFLAEAGAMLGASLDYEATLANVTRLVVPHLADWCTIDMLAGERIERLTAAHVDPAKAQVPMDLARRFPLETAAAGPLQEVLRSGEPMLIGRVSEEVLRSAARSEEHLELLRSLGLESGMLVPLTARNRILGVMAFISSDPARVYIDEDLTLAVELARRCGLAVDNARLYKERSYIARTLQESLLPGQIPDIPGYEVAARFRAAGEGNEVGGDFFDLFEVPSGWAVVIGDVSGKGAAAAAVTALARYTVRAAALTAGSPAEVLRFLNAAMLRHRVHDRFCTVSLAFLHEADGERVLEVANGGHPLPLLAHPDGSVETMGAPGTLIGVVPDPDLEDRRHPVAPGDRIVFYTDGVTEARMGDGLLGGQGLAAMVGRLAGSGAAGTAEDIEARVVEASTDQPRDDIAIVVLQARDVDAGRLPAEAITRDRSFERGLSLRLAGGTGAPSVARAALLELAPRVEPAVLENARLLTSELVTNSVRHARVSSEDPIAMEVRLWPEGLRVEVIDHGPGFNRRPSNPPLDQPSGRGLFLVERIADRWGTAEGGRRVWFELERGSPEDRGEA